MNPSLFLAIALAAGSLAAADAPSTRLEQDGRFCSATAFTQFLACRSEIVDDLFSSQAFCTNLSDATERFDCFTAANRTYREDLETCREQQEARRDLCRVLGEERYEPDFDPANFDSDFANPLSPNPYFPLAAGNKWTYTGGDEVVTDEVLEKTKLIAGVACVVVENTAKADGELIELTADWYARRNNGDIVYCGEEVRNFETFEGDDPAEPELIDTDGSFKAGREAKPGLLFPAVPMVGQVYRQEWAPGEAEDVGEVISVNYGFGSNVGLDRHAPQELVEMFCADDCIVTRDSSPIEPGVFALKYYARDIGLIFEVEFDEDGEVEVVELVDCSFDPRCQALPGAETEE